MKANVSLVKQKKDSLLMVINAKNAMLRVVNVMDLILLIVWIALPINISKKVLKFVMIVLMIMDISSKIWNVFSVQKIVKYVLTKSSALHVKMDSISGMVSASNVTNREILLIQLINYVKNANQHAKIVMVKQKILAQNALSI